VDTKQRIRQLMDDRNWSEYRLAKETGLPSSTIANIFYRNTIPGILTLETTCSAFGITLSQFFGDGELLSLNQEQREL
jgi:Predicted transcriptional regulators